MSERKNEWGLQPCVTLNEDDALWGARAIWEAGGEIDIVHDRQSWSGNPTMCRGLSNWLTKVGLPGMKRVLRMTGLSGRSDYVVTFKDDHYIVQGNPRASHGYLYLVAHKV